MDNFPWMASYPEGIDWQAKLEPKPLYVLLDDAVRQWPDRLAQEFMGRSWTYREIGNAVDRMAQSFRKLGVDKGVNVGIYLPNCPQFVITYYAILKAGGTVVNFSPLYSPAELRHQIEDSDTRIMVTLDLAVLYPNLAPLLAQTPLETIIVSRFADWLPPAKRFLFRWLKRSEQVAIPDNDAHQRFETLLRAHPLQQAAEIDPLNDVAVLQYTGGTTGVPKGAMLTHANLSINVQQAGLWCDPLLKPGSDIMMAVLPFFHVFAMTVVMNLGLARGMTLILHPRFDLVNVLKSLHRQRPTIMPGVPTMYAAINNHPHLNRYDLSSLALCVSGGAPLPHEVQQQFESLTGCRLVEGYGLTECAPIAAVNPLVGKGKDGSIGLPLPGTSFHVMSLDDPDKELPVGEIGELCIAGPQVMPGYRNRPDESAQALHGGMLHTGDVGFIAPDGYITIVDRAKEMILCGGFNIYPRNIEEALYEHPDVLEAAVVGVPDATHGQRVRAYVVMKEGRSVSDEQVRDFLRGRVAKYAVPKEVIFRTELPKSPIGKILKKALLAEEGITP